MPAPLEGTFFSLFPVIPAGRAGSPSMQAAKPALGVSPRPGPDWGNGYSGETLPAEEDDNPLTEAQVSVMNALLSLPRLEPTLQLQPRPHRNPRRNPALQRRGLQGLRLDPCRDHPGTRTLRHPQAIRPTPKGHQAPVPLQTLATHPQPVVPPTGRPTVTRGCTRRQMP